MSVFNVRFTDRERSFAGGWETIYWGSLFTDVPCLSLTSAVAWGAGYFDLEDLQEVEGGGEVQSLQILA